MDDEGAIIARVLDGETQAFRALVERYQGPVIRMAAGMLNDRDAAEDVAQEVFLAAYGNLAAHDSRRSAFSTWLFTIARHLSINAARQRAVRIARQQASGERESRTGAGIRPGRDQGESPSDSVAAREFHELLDHALGGLPPDQRIAFVLAEFEGLTYEQIAQIEGVRIGTVRSRISRAKTKLRAVLESREVR